LNWFELLTELIDMRSFSNLWFWIALAVMWSSASHWVLGVPYDMVLRAARFGGQAEEDLEDIVRVNVNRLLYIADVSGLWLVGLVSFVLTVLGAGGFGYDLQFMQALFLLAFPVSLVGGLSVRAARDIRATGLSGAELRHRIRLHRLAVQVIGMIAIFVTAMWGMYQNLTATLPDILFKPLG
jgi:hypothetical protein